MNNKLLMYSILGLGGFFLWKKFLSKPAVIHVDSLDAEIPKITKIDSGAIAGFRRF